MGVVSRCIRCNRYAALGNTTLQELFVYLYFKHLKWSLLYSIKYIFNSRTSIVIIKSVFIFQKFQDYYNHNHRVLQIVVVGWSLVSQVWVELWRIGQKGTELEEHAPQRFRIPSSVEVHSSWYRYGDPRGYYAERVESTTIISIDVLFCYRHSVLM